MFCAAIQEFAFSLPADAGLLRASLKAGEPIDQNEVLSLAAMAQSLFITATLASRESGRIDDCRQLWKETAQVFEELCLTWANTTSDDQSITWLRNKLHRLLELCEDRVGLYSITEEDRSEYAERRSGLPDEGHDPQPEPSAEFSKLETASIERAYRRL